MPKKVTRKGTPQTFYLSPEQIEWLRTKSEETGAPQAEILRRILQKHIENEKPK